MNREEIIKLAREADVPEYDDDDCENGVRFEAGICSLERFANLIAAAERERCANARLIDAAPELLEALEGMIATYTRERPVDDRKFALYNARAAIAKAKGE